MYWLSGCRIKYWIFLLNVSGKCRRNNDFCSCKCPFLYTAFFLCADNHDLSSLDKVNALELMFFVYHNFFNCIQLDLKKIVVFHYIFAPFFLSLCMSSEQFGWSLTTGVLSGTMAISLALDRTDQFVFWISSWTMSTYSFIYLTIFNCAAS